MHYRKVHLLDFKNKTKRDVSVYLFMYQFVSVSIFSYFLRVLWYVCKCGCIHKLQRTTFDSILFPLWVPVIKFSTAQAALNQLTDSTYVYVWVGVGGAHTHVYVHTPVEARRGYYFLGNLSPYTWGGNLPLETKACIFS